MDTPLRFLVLGTGNIAGTWLRALARVPGSVAAGAVSRSGRRPADLPPDAPVYPAPEAAPPGSYDAVILATPNGMHPAGALAAAARGKHVLAEKPLAVTLEECDRIIDACAAAGVRLGICFQRRMSPDNQAVRELLRAGRLGRVRAADMAVRFYRDQAYYDSAAYRGGYALDGGGAFMQQAVHNADLLNWFLGRPTEVVARCATLAHAMEAEDHGAAILSYPDGALATFTASTVCRPGYPPRFELFTEKGSLTLENDRLTRWDIVGLDRPAAGESLAHTGADTAAVADTSGHEKIIADFVAAVRDGRDPAIPGPEAREATELVLRIYAASGLRTV